VNVLPETTTPDEGAEYDTVAFVPAAVMLDGAPTDEPFR
jgi:hypothetical protein